MAKITIRGREFIPIDEWPTGWVLKRKLAVDATDGDFVILCYISPSGWIVSMFNESFIYDKYKKLGVVR